MLRTALLVDYDPRSIGRIRALASGAGLRVVLARDGLAGIRTFAQTLPDVTLVQDLVPRMSGVELCRRLKNTEHGRRTPVILISSACARSRRAGIEAGCDLRLDKPFDDETFLALLERVLPTPTTRRCDPVAPGPPLEIPENAPVASVDPRVAPSIPIRFESGELDDRLDEIFRFATPLGDADTRPPAPPRRSDTAAPSKPARARKKPVRSKSGKRTAKKKTSRPAAKTRPKKKKATTRSKTSPARRARKRQAEGAPIAEGSA